MIYERGPVSDADSDRDMETSNVMARNTKIIGNNDNNYRPFEKTNDLFDYISHFDQNILNDINSLVKSVGNSRNDVSGLGSGYCISGKYYKCVSFESDG